MIRQKNVLKSTKVYGKYERPLIRRLKVYFEEAGFEVVPHARFNIAWGTIISDIDLLLIKDNKLTAIEVKSRHDSLSKARRQIAKLQDFVDYVYIATDRKTLKFSMEDTGIILLGEEHITVAKKAKRIQSFLGQRVLSVLPKKCLLRLVDGEASSQTRQLPKFELAEQASAKLGGYTLKQNVQEIVTCGLHCSTKCPIWAFQQCQKI